MVDNRFPQHLNPCFMMVVGWWLIIIFRNLFTLASWCLVVDEWLKISDNPYLSTCLHDVAAQHLSKVEPMAIDGTSMLFYQLINEKDWQALKSDWFYPMRLIGWLLGWFCQNHGIIWPSNIVIRWCWSRLRILPKTAQKRPCWFIFWWNEAINSRSSNAHQWIAMSHFNSKFNQASIVLCNFLCWKDLEKEPRSVYGQEHHIVQLAIWWTEGTTHSEVRGGSEG